MISWTTGVRWNKKLFVHFPGLCARLQQLFIEVCSIQSSSKMRVSDQVGSILSLLAHTVVVLLALTAAVTRAQLLFQHLAPHLDCAFCAKSFRNLSKFSI